MLKQILIVLALVITLVVPFALRPPQPPREASDETLTIITPHNEAIRHEFTAGFRQWYSARTGRSVFIDWRVIGGTSDIARFLDSEYVSSFKNYWTNELKRPWSIEVFGGFANPRLTDDAPPIAKQAREAFLNSDVSCGIDLFFGGGPYDFIAQANAGRIVANRMLETHP